MFPTYMLKFNILSSAMTLKNASKYDREILMPCLQTSRVPTHGTAMKRQRTQQPRDNKKPKQSRATMHVSLAFFLSKMSAILERTLIKKYTTKGLFRVENKKGDSSGVASLKKDGNTVGISRGKAEVFNSHFLSVLTKDQVTSSTHEYPRCPQHPSR